MIDCSCIAWMDSSALVEIYAIVRNLKGSNIDVCWAQCNHRVGRKMTRHCPNDIQVHLFGSVHAAVKAIVLEKVGKEHMIPFVQVPLSSKNLDKHNLLENSKVGEEEDSISVKIQRLNSTPSSSSSEDEEEA